MPATTDPGSRGACETPAWEGDDVDCYRDAVDGRFGGGGTWSEEARRVRLLAAELGVALDDETLIFYDIRDLMSLHLRLQRAVQSRAGRSGAG
jgi:hypothetical protein